MVEIHPLVCPNCSGPVASGAAACPFCGTPLAVRVPGAALDTDAILRRYASADLDDLRRAAARRPTDPAACYALGIAYARAGLWDDADEPFRKAADRVPENADFQYALAATIDRLVLAGAKRRDGTAADRLQRALAADPRHLPSLWLAAIRASRTGDGATFAAMLRRAAEVSPDLVRQVLAGFNAANPDAVAARLGIGTERARLRDRAALEARRVGGTTLVSAIMMGVMLVFIGGLSDGFPAALWLLVPAFALAGFVGQTLIAKRAREASAAIALPTAREQALIDATDPDIGAVVDFAGEVIATGVPLQAEMSVGFPPPA